MAMGLHIITRRYLPQGIAGKPFGAGSVWYGGVQGNNAVNSLVRDSLDVAKDEKHLISIDDNCYFRHCFDIMELLRV